ncbi:MAG: L-seryl-tRNA(Sec) selenium transferase [Helicobacter sp.]|nr:L-seryl-tRNA(Sec) selenium transferase [Helicobacteraceae bacterium]MDY3112814.1 L-seryl-tRNA(Sec) selenium transferase [Helicobacter sp.]
MQEILRQIPKVDKLINAVASELKTQGVEANLSVLKKIATAFLDKYRKNLIENEFEAIKQFSECVESLKMQYLNKSQKSLKPLINATGIVVHTNLGRSVFSRELLNEVLPILTSYNNLEYDLKEGKRGERYTHLMELFKTLLGVEDVLVVNNNAAAVFLILNTFAKNREVIISRGELIEIGGSFRIPKVMEEAGVILKEVGTTNKTRLSDYVEALSENTAMIFKAHKSNYVISGFSEEVEFKRLVELAGQKGVIDYYDLGSGYFDSCGLESFVEFSLESIAAIKPSLVSFSGDKLLGGTQAGIIFGKKELIAKLKKNQLLRMLRVDKFSIAMLEATLRAYLQNDFKKIPTIALLRQNPKELELKAVELCGKIPPFFKPQVIKSKSYSGGGAMPGHSLESFCVRILALRDFSEEKMERYLRENAIITRCESGAILLDVMTLLSGDIDKIAEAFKRLEGDLCSKI